jgi:hypothetical protein
MYIFCVTNWKLQADWFCGWQHALESMNRVYEALLSRRQSAQMLKNRFSRMVVQPLRNPSKVLLGYDPASVSNRLSVHS